VQLIARRTTKIAAVALANKTARVIWAIMTRGEPYREPVAPAAWGSGAAAPTILGKATKE
jgi:hypothetical protein